MIHRNPICVRMLDGQICEDGDVVEEISTGIKWTFRGIEHDMKAILASRVSYKSKDTIWASEDVREYDAEVEPSMALPLYEFVNLYMISSKWDIENHRCASEEESAIADALINQYRTVQLSLSHEEWMSIYSRDAIAKAKF